ncbi:acyl-phosphate glycerol 3-phosphate acyltransferase [Paenibacillus swuensis]|uniref:1-acyl-sn-glycerol-3-phosphate acyltransferase n=1 Tax=Paenibacillus swuensis TaxID=1178515 RepID=A0A172TE53_9BACL|nr:lysophospholipid acyltransferase family protein [Paenibacillus swuensis]ANE45290.1 acyl-phosphate glycerol 3-phosphate acyltransferase [Paenibacillus swuensis]
MRTIVWFIYFWIYLIALMPSLWKANRLEREGKLEERDALTAAVVRRWARSLLRVASVKVTLKGAEHLPKEAAVLVSNHQGNFDVPILLGYVGTPGALMAKKELLRMPIISTWMHHLRCIFVDRENVRQAMKSLQQAAELVSGGHSIIIFPEGTRSKGDAIGEFKGGGFKIATKAGAPIVPIRINGSYKVMEANTFGFLIRPAEVEVTILPPVETSTLTKEEANALPERVRDMIEHTII